MRVIKRLYLFILKSFLPLFAMTFFIVLFIVLMQFLWKYIDDLVGKGLSVAVLAELFFYAAVSMVPMALPLAILLASLMTFGNFGEKFELTAMKASGISLLKVMSPLVALIFCIAVGAFFFQNDVLPKAQVKMWTLLFSARQKQPELEIPEGSFYDQIPGYNLFVKSKNPDTGMLRDVMIYDVSRGGDNATILLSDSARLAFTPDMRYLYLHLFNGEQFENLRDQSNLDRNVPFRRESFVEKELMIKFDANFNRLDEGGMRKQYVGKNISELKATIDSLTVRVDSIGAGYADDIRRVSFSSRGEAKAVAPMNLDSLITALAPGQKQDLFANARQLSKRRYGELEYKAENMAAEKKTIRRHQIEMLKKYTLSVACMVFFFIGAPLGAIIRKGGIGTPLVISVLLFLVYYIFDNTGYKMARDGHWNVWFGMWLSSLVLIPLGVYVTWKAMNDSSVFDKDLYVNWLNKILGRRQPRSVRAKEVIINDFSPVEAVEKLTSLQNDFRNYMAAYPGPMAYKAYWMRGYNMARLRILARRTDAAVEYLTDCSDPIVVNKLTEVPVFGALWIYSPCHVKWLSWIFMAVFPVGIVVWLLGRDAQKKLKSDMRRAIDAFETEKKLLTEEEHQPEQ